MIGYGGMLLESFVAIMAMIAATVLDPGVFFAINSPAGRGRQNGRRGRRDHLFLGLSGHRRTDGATGTRYGRDHPVCPHRRRPLAGGRHGQHFCQRLRPGHARLWYHFAIMFEAVFILTTLDAGTRVGRFMLQDLLGNLWPRLGADFLVPLGDPELQPSSSPPGVISSISASSTPMAASTSCGRCSASPTRCSAAIALSVGTGILVKSGKLRYRLGHRRPSGLASHHHEHCGMGKTHQRRRAHRFLCRRQTTSPPSLPPAPCRRNKRQSRRN